MRQPSLTTRMSLMFMLGVIFVLVVAGLSFHALAKHHFNMLDRQTLEDKLASTQHILNNTQDRQRFNSARPQLNALLGAHEDLATVIFDSKGKVIFSEPTAFKFPADYREQTPREIWQWTEDGRQYKGIRIVIPTQSQSVAASVLLVIDVTTHEHFFEQLRRWFGLGLVISALVSAALGYVVARSGLQPLRQVTQVARSMSARSLDDRIPLEPVPRELQELVISFNEMLARLDDAFARLSNFSADIAHELRTPVSNLVTHTEVVLSQKRDIESYQENLYSNLEDLNKMSRMIDDMLFLAKSDNGLITPKQEPIELSSLVSKLIEYYGLLADEMSITFSVSGEGRVLGDQLMLDRAISNLLSNALRYTAPGNTIAIAIETVANCVSLSVKNPGETINPEYVGKLFDRFYRADPARREGGPSNAGLGLAITQSIVEAHKGEIVCSSANGVTTFQMSFPVCSVP
ncbi:heavy metal sensor histidine kinase [Pseudomonas sp.]|uniref:heavy metal sensor histidine kinase n=1 Tax=Pseudomonas sp. TaxID=306 RepID=UPI00257EC528|nr:heavy metal sensor histidine kinase [Pseudomonas sp.]